MPEPPSHDEVGRLARTMNSMLARLDDAAERQRRFVSDASHELQSPLTSLRARLEVDLAARAEPDWRAGEAEALVEVIEMQRLVDDLLTLARLDARRRARRCRCRSTSTTSCCSEVERLRTRGGVAVDVHGVSARSGARRCGPTPARDPQRARQRRTARRAARSRCRCRKSTTIEVLRIADDGTGIPVEHRERIFERFGRIDDARTRDGAPAPGSGLAITREIVEAHGGRITIADSPVGATFVLELPGATAE